MKITNEILYLLEGGTVNVPQKVLDPIEKWFEQTTKDMRVKEKAKKRISNVSKKFTLKAKDFPFGKDTFKSGKKERDITVEVLSPAKSANVSFGGTMGLSRMTLNYITSNDTIKHELTHFIQNEFDIGFRGKVNKLDKNPKQQKFGTLFGGKRHANAPQEFKTRLADEISVLKGTDSILNVVDSVDEAIKMWFGLGKYSNIIHSGTYKDMDAKTKQQREIRNKFVKDFSIAAHKAIKLEKPNKNVMIELEAEGLVKKGRNVVVTGYDPKKNTISTSTKRIEGVALPAEDAKKFINKVIVPKLHQKNKRYSIRINSWSIDKVDQLTYSDLIAGHDPVRR